MLRFVIAAGLGILAAGYVIRRETSAPASDAQGPSQDPTDPPVSQAAADLASEVIEAAKNAAAGVQAVIFGTPYDSLINSAALANDIEPQVLYNLLFTESHFRPEIINGTKRSPVGALGIAQFMPSTAQQELGSVAAALDPNQAIPGAARYLAKLRAQLGGDLAKAVAAYNWGVGNVQRKGLAKAPPETVAYVQAILGENIA